ncbi:MULTISPECIES: DUF4652 domain-containing protein [Paenibacillus]|uniref:DUF4652 domain-containing protein n=1 Tax=Paenibacillus TaxID=44249 RepID=UPI001643369F|nr:DUF4652 domain-containing protein [Paenibacillus sp. IHBB 10380]
MFRTYRSFVAVGLWILTVLLAGCESHPATPDVSLRNSLELGENVLYSENQPEIILQEKDQSTTISSKEDFPSKPIVSPDGLKLAFIAPFEFELSGEIWLYDHTRNHTNKILSSDDFPSDLSPKRLYWLDEGHLLISTGNKYGTIPSTRQLFVYSLKSGNMQEKYAVQETQHIASITFKEALIQLKIETYDDNFMEITGTQNVNFPVSQFLD